MLAWQIASRYLFSRKSHSAINAITVVAACGVAVIAMALVCTLSVYNGFEDLVRRLCSNFDPDLRIEATVGKSFEENRETVLRIKELSEVVEVAPTLEETVLLSYAGRQLPARIKGVDSTFRQIAHIDSIIRRGEFLLSDPVAEYAVVGAGVASRLGINAGFIRPFTVYCPRREGKISILRPEDAFAEGELFCGGVFAVEQAEYDDDLLLAPIGFVRRLLSDSLLTTAYEVKLRDGVSPEQIKQTLQKMLGEDFRVLTRMEQQADVYKIMQIEKWITYAIILFILLIASFNIIGALSMLIVDKESELHTLRCLGASETLIRRIFFIEGWLISGSGALVGICLGVVLCLLQQHYGFIPLGDGSAIYVVDAYPVRLVWSDIVWSAVGVFLLGGLAVIYPLKTLSSK